MTDADGIRISVGGGHSLIKKILSLGGTSTLAKPKEIRFRIVQQYVADEVSDTTLLTKVQMLVTKNCFPSPSKF
jgi:hypothetical protein